jgi:hypothetical protein
MRFRPTSLTVASIRRPVYVAASDEDGLPVVCRRVFSVRQRSSRRAGVRSSADAKIPSQTSEAAARVLCDAFRNPYSSAV